MSAFRDASVLDYDADIAEDSYFNYAKLAFDLNDDHSVFEDYLAKYSELEKGDRIYSYIAVAALHERDYEGAIAAYDQIEDLDDNMISNYLKANYLRAAQLIRNSSYRKAIPFLKAVIYYTGRGSRLNQLSRYWLAESHYRNGEFAKAREMFTELYNVSALYGESENRLLAYNIAYCNFKEQNYPSALRWFDD
jgi:TolA-binding protein